MGKMRGESIGERDHWYADSCREHYDEQVPLIRKQITIWRKTEEKDLHHCGTSMMDHDADAGPFSKICTAINFWSMFFFSFVACSHIGFRLARNSIYSNLLHNL